MPARVAQTPTIVEINNSSFTTTASADSLNDDFGRRLGLKGRNMVARLAIGRSLSISSQPPPITESERGKVIKGVNLFGNDLRIWLSLLLEHVNSNDITLEDIQDLVSRHWSRGLMLLGQDWKSSGEDFDRFVVTLASQAGLRAEGSTPSFSGDLDELFLPRATAVVLPIGELSVDTASNQKVEWSLNAPGVSPHIAVLGSIGSGKTRTAMGMLQEIKKQSGSPIILFDMAKGDLAGDAKLVSSLGASVIDPLQTPIPLDVLYATAQELKQAAMRFRESFKRVPANKIGDAQGDVLREAAERAFAGAHPVKLTDIYDRLKEIYATKRKKDDIVTAAFKDMTTWDLFEPKLSPNEFFRKTWIIDLHKAPEQVKRLVCFLLFDAAYTFLGHSEDTPLDSHNNRALRLVLAVDEARLVLGYEHQSLISLVRESRSKGGVMMFISQSPDDFDQKTENFFENIGLGICFRTAARSSALNSLFGQTVELGGLKNGVCVTRLPEHGMIQVKAWEAIEEKPGKRPIQNNLI